MKKNLLAMVALLSACGAVFAQATPVGVWKSIDDKTKAERSQVRISESGGVLSGRIEKLLATDAKPDAKCDKCEDDRKDKPIVGMEIIRGVKKAEAENTWEGGTILDPAEGKVYKVRLQTADGGKKLEVRGYVGTPMLGRTQTWVRVE
ncbi:MAG TPA: DUF2147 domain-containing protein [Rubrivivax sp.]|jgi:uncharacterized protein (DUF2147 family)|nr:DUF2147 domain-containing protein [Rubrivivax sp.]